MSRIKLAPSILAADFGHLVADCQRAIEAGAEWLHIDVMDGHFVPNISFGPLIVQALRPLADQYGTILDVHLMIERPSDYVAAFAKAGADIITVHVEATVHIHRLIQQIKELGCKAGVTLNPGTSLATIAPVLAEVDLLLIMSVNPGYGGQAYITSSTEKIRFARKMLDQIDSKAWLEVDGGVKLNNVAELIEAGATVIVAGSAVFGGARSIEENVTDFLAS